MKKLLLTILSIVCALSFTLGIVGCGDNNDENPHEHTYSANYSSDDTYHWLPATCEHTDLVDQKGEHTYERRVLNDDGTMYVYTCTVCGKTKTENVIPPYFGLGGKLDLNYTDKLWDDETNRYIVEFLAGLSQDGVDVDLMGIGGGEEDDFALFVRDSVIYIGTGNEEVEIADLSELSTQLGKFDFQTIDLRELLDEAIAETNSSLNIDVETLAGAIISALQDQAFTNIYRACMVGAYNYLAVESKAVEGNTVTTYDLHKTVDNLLDKVKEVGEYLDLNVNVETATIKSLYNSEAVKSLLEPLLKEMQASDLQAILTHAKAIIENISAGGENGAKKLQFPFEIIDAGEMTAYEYIGKYLDVEITYGTQTIVLGDITLKDAFGEFYAQQDGTAKLVDVIEESKEYLDSIIPVLKFSYTTEGTSAEMGKLLGVSFELKISNGYNSDYQQYSYVTHVKYEFDLVYEEDVLVGFTFKGDYDETGTYFEHDFSQDLEMSLLPTENGYQLKFSDVDNSGYSMVFVADFNMYLDDDGDLTKVEIIATAKEQNKTIFDFDISSSVEYDVIADVKQAIGLGVELNLERYYSDGALEDTLFAKYYTNLIYEDDFLKQIDTGIAYDYEVADYNGEYMQVNGYSESLEFDNEINFTYNDKGLLTSVANEYDYNVINLEIALEPYLCAIKIDFTYSDSDLLTKAVLSVEDMQMITVDIAYLEDSDMITSIKTSLPNDFAVLEVKLDYNDDLEVSKMEMVLDFIMTGVAGEEGEEDVIPPYNGQFKVSIIPVLEGEEVTGIKGEIYLDTRDETYEGTYEFNVYTEEPEFIELPEIDGEKLSLEDLMEMFGWIATA